MFSLEPRTKFNILFLFFLLSRSHASPDLAAPRGVSSPTLPDLVDPPFDASLASNASSGAPISPSNVTSSFQRFQLSVPSPHSQDEWERALDEVSVSLKIQGTSPARRRNSKDGILVAALGRWRSTRRSPLIMTSSSTVVMCATVLAAPQILHTTVAVVVISIKAKPKDFLNFSNADQHVYSSFEAILARSNGPAPGHPTPPDVPCVP